MSSFPETKLVPPPDEFLPSFDKNFRDELIILATKSSRMSSEPLQEIDDDSKRFANGDRQVWGLSKESIPNVLAICRVDYDHEYFVAMPKHPWQIPGTFNFLLRSSGSRADRGPVVTITGEVVEADLCGLIFTKFLDEDINSGDKIVLKNNLNPTKQKEHAIPEIFTFNSAFNSAIDIWPQVANWEDINRLSPASREVIANHFLGYGLEVLANESDDKYIRLAGQRLIYMCENDLLNLHLTCFPYQVLNQELKLSNEQTKQILPEEHGLAYLPNLDKHLDRVKGTVLLPLQWVAEAIKRPVVGLAHLIRVSSFARDDYFGKLKGSEMVFSREFRMVAEVQNFDLALRRADGLVSKFLEEAERSDLKIYGIRTKLDNYCLEIRKKNQLFGVYDDPPEGKRLIVVPKL